MGTVGAGFSMSLDGFIAGPNDDMQQVFAWMFKGDQDVQVSIGDEAIDLKLTSEGVDQREGAAQAIGAILSGRRMFDVAGAWGGKHPLNVPIVVLTHHPPQEWVSKPGSPFTFVTDGIESAVAKAKAIAGDKNVGVGGADVTRQCLKAGLLDEIGIDLVPVLLGSGVRLFEQIGIEPVELEILGVTEDTGVTHLRYRVVK
ncbi:MAG: dihydrofolate reductase family protein [Anaerolineae bacterium]|nr:dihydrofolate reductase family protein [Anaerolineae bacterium]